MSDVLFVHYTQMPLKVKCSIIDKVSTQESPPCSHKFYLTDDLMAMIHGLSSSASSICSAAGFLRRFAIALK